MSKRKRMKTKERETVQDTAAFDAFQNMLARMGNGTPSMLEATNYVNNRLTSDRRMLDTLYRSHWIIQRIIGAIPADMTKNWYKLSGDILPDALDRYSEQERLTQVQAKIKEALIWSRLYGGSLAVMMISGDGERMHEPLDIDRIMPGSFKGLLVLDRWNGIIPSLELVRDITDPEFGTPNYYTIDLNSSGGSAVTIHHSRILRFTGRDLPFHERVMEQYWGASEVEAVYDELLKRDNASWSIASLLFRANLLFFHTAGADFHMATAPGAAQQRFYNSMSALNQILSNNGLTLMSEKDSVTQHSYQFSGLPEVYDRFMMDIAGAAGIPVTRLFGRSPAGMNATGESDMALYYELLQEQQQSKLYPVLAKLTPVLQMSAWGVAPDGISVQFNPVETVNPKEAMEIAAKHSDIIVAEYNAGIISEQIALEELKKHGSVSGMWSSITDEYIAQAEAMPQQQGEEEDPLAGFGSSLFDAFNEADVNREEDGEFAPKEGGSSGSSDYDDSEPSKPKEKPKEPEEPEESSTATSEEESSGNEGEGSAEYGPQPRQKAKGTLDKKERDEYNEEVKGIVSSTGVTITSFWGHAFDRIGERVFSCEEIISTLKKPDMSFPGNTKDRDRWVYQTGRVRVVVQISTGEIVSVVDVFKDREG